MSAYTLHFVAGLPRSGSTALLTLLAQNPRLHTAPVSGLHGIVTGVHTNWDKIDFHQELPNPQAKKNVLRAMLEHYHATDRPVVLDKDRMWVRHIELVEAALERPIKIILPVRPIPEILASFETLRQRQPLELTGPDEALGATSTIESRAAYFTADAGPIGATYNAMKNAVVSGFLDRLLFVDYDKLVSDPREQLARIYAFLGEEPYPHDTRHIKPMQTGDSRAHKFVGLHDVRPQFAKTSRPAEAVLGQEVFEKYNKPLPWLEWI